MFSWMSFDVQRGRRLKREDRGLLTNVSYPDSSDPPRPQRCCPELLPKAAEFYGVTRTSGIGSISYTNWEADMVMTCICDWGYMGGDCSLRMCPKGDDPVTTLQDSPRVEMTVAATAGTLAGNFLLSFQVRSKFQRSEEKLPHTKIKNKVVRVLVLNFTATCNITNCVPSPDLSFLQ